MILAFVSINIHAQVASVDIKDVNSHNVMGHITFENSPYGLLIKPNVSGLTPGMHGFHLHEHASCADAGSAAGGHFDPQKTNKHLGPFAKGHLGDLPALFVNKEGHANQVILAPRLKLKQLKGHSVMVHQGGDNYSDSPQPLGGGGKRAACGVVK